MNGPREKWISEGRPTSTEVPSYEAQQFSAQEGDAAIRAKRDEVHGRARPEDPPRRRALAAGVLGRADRDGRLRAGGRPARRAHPGRGQSVPWAQAVQEDGTFKSADELRELYTDKGVIDGNPIIAYCRIGERSAHTWFVLHELLGEDDVKNYDGSWTEWGNLVNVPIEKDV